jgi:glycosyltransferase involved in cell wall biosynthesis
VDDETGSGTILLRALPEVKVYHLPIYYWHYTADEIEHFHFRTKSERPQHVLHHLINESGVCEDLNARGIAASFVHHNAFLDERIFSINTEEEKIYDAVYTARMNPFKRHHLARDIGKLLLIGGIHGRSDSYEYLNQLQREMPQATFTHAADNEFMPAHDVARLVNRARVGLCLSEREGGMFSATEYSLCGLPIVSTRSIGGREEMFDTRFARIVPDSAKAVREAVQELISLNLPSQWIRQVTLSRIWEHRRRFVEIVQRIFDYEMATRDFAREWYPRFFNKFAKWRNPDEVMQHIKDDCGSGAFSSLHPADV